MAQQWLSASDPYWSQFGNVAGRDPESGEFTNPYISTIRGLQAPENWRGVARQLGYQGPFETQVISSDPGEGGGGLVNVPAPEFLQFIQQKQAEGYDFVTKADQINKDRQTIGLRTPTGEVINQTPVKVSGFGDFFKEFVLPSVAAYGAVNFLGPRLEGLTNALSGGGQLSAADLANIPTGTMGQVSQPPALGAEGAGAMYTDVSMAPGTETGLFGEQFFPIKNYPYSDVTLNTLAEPAASVTTPAAAATDAANAMRLGDLTQLQANPQLAQRAMDLAGGSADLVPGVMGGGQFAAAGNALAPAAAAVNAIAPAAAPAAGVMEGMVPGGLESVGISPAARELMATGAVVAGAGAKPGLTGIPYLDKAIDFVTSPAGAAIVSGVGNVVGGIAGANAAEKAAETQAAAADRAVQLQREMYEKSLELGKPYYEAGINALGKLTRGEIINEPGYAFRLGEGMKALERVQAARGNMLSGGALKAGQRYAQDLASQEYGNAYNRLANIAGLGQTATTQAGAAGQNYASQAGELGLQQGNALAQGRIGRMSSYGNALLGAAGALQDYVQAPMKEQMFRDIYGRLMGKP